MATDATTGRLQAGRVIASATATVGRNAGSLVGLAVVLGLLPALVFGLFYQPAIDTSDARAVVAIFASPLFWISLLISIASYCVLQAAVTSITVMDLDGRRPDMAVTLATALRCALPLLGLYILFAVAVALGFVALVVPGFMLAAMWCVAGVPLVVERAGIIESFRRSRYLTKGSRWPIFGIFVVIGLITSAARGIVAVGMGGSAIEVSSSPGLIALNSVIGAVETLTFAVVIAAIYVELRTVKEGASTTDLAAIFS